MEILLWLACAFIGAMVMSPHNKAGSGLLLGLILGPLGVIITIIWRWNLGSAQPSTTAPLIVAADGTVQPAPAPSRTERDCPHCAERILAAAKVCKHCGRDVEPIPAPTTGHCPNCGQLGLALNATSCHQCGALFNTGDAWKPIPD